MQMQQALQLPSVNDAISVVHHADLHPDLKTYGYKALDLPE